MSRIGSRRQEIPHTHPLINQTPKGCGTQEASRRVKGVPRANKLRKLSCPTFTLRRLEVLDVNVWTLSQLLPSAVKFKDRNATAHKSAHDENSPLSRVETL